MATIQTSIRMNDNVSAVLTRIQRGLSQTSACFEQLNTASGSSIDNSELNRTVAELNQIQQQLNGAGNEAEELNQNMQQANDSTNKLNGTASKLLGILGSIFAIKKLVSLSDEITSTTARIDLMNDGLQTTEELTDLIMQSANNSRASFQALSQVVAKLGNNAGDAFGSSKEIVAFAELVSKQMTISGASATEASNAMLQLTQALGSGVLRGDELNSIFEQAPTLIQSIADYMGVSIGEIRGLASEGKITADIVKNAMFASADKINDKFNKMPMTWGQVWTEICNKAIKVGKPLLSFINLLANNWEVLEPIVLGVATALGIYTTALLITKGVQAISAFTASAHAAALAMEAGATFSATAAQYGFNAALYACPLTWILMAIIAIIAAVVAIIKLVIKLTGSTLSALGVIAGAIAVAGVFIWNTVIGLLNSIIQAAYSTFVEPFIGIVEFVLNACNGGFNSFGDACINLIGQLISWFLSLGKIVTTIIDAIFGTDWTSGLTDLQNNVTQWGKNDGAITLSREAPKIDARVDYGDAWNAGTAWGDGISNQINDFFNGSSSDSLGDYLGDISTDTGNISDSLEVSEENLKYLRDIAERDTINRFTTAEIKIDMKNNNNINSSMDIDGVVSLLEDKLNEAMQTAAEGVHE